MGLLVVVCLGLITYVVCLLFTCWTCKLGFGLIMVSRSLGVLGVLLIYLFLLGFYDRVCFGYCF